MASTSPVRTSITMPQAPIAWNSSIALRQLVAHHGLHAHVERQAQRRRVLVQPLVEEALDAGDAVAVHVHAAEHLRGDAAERIVAVLGRLEIDAGDAEGVDRQFLPRR